jgi:hypothetical protein
MGPMDDESGKDSSGTRMNRVRAVWRRNDSQLGDSNGPVVKVTQRRTTPGSDTEDSDGVQPVEVVVAPLAIIAHSRIAATLAAFPQEIPGSHFSRVLSSVRGLKGDSFVERLVRATTSIDLELRAQPWRLASNHLLFLLPSAHSSNDPKTCSHSSAAALEISRLAVEWSPGWREGTDGFGDRRRSRSRGESGEGPAFGSERRERGVVRAGTGGVHAPGRGYVRGGPGERPGAGNLTGGWNLHVVARL